MSKYKITFDQDAVFSYKLYEKKMTTFKSYWKFLGSFCSEFDAVQEMNRIRKMKETARGYPKYYD